MKYTELKEGLNYWIELNFDGVTSIASVVSSLLEKEMQLACFLCDCAYYCDREQEHEQAIRYLKAGLLIQPNQFGLLANLGLQYWSLGDKEKGLNYLNKSLEQEPDIADTLVNKATLLVEMNRYTEALEICDSIELLHPEDGGTYYNKGKIFTVMGLYDKAIENLLKAMELEPQNITIPEFISEIYYEYLENEEEAIRYLEMVEKMSDGLPF